MIRGRFYSVAMPIWAILYVIIGLIARSSLVWAVGAMIFALIAVMGRVFPSHSGDQITNQRPTRLESPHDRVL